MSRVVEFLTIPESILSVYFLIIFIVIFAYGIYRIGKDKSEVEITANSIINEYQQNSDMYDAKVFFERKVDKLKINDSYVDDLSNLFVSIGILGTFIGLGIAIQGAAELLNDEKIDLHQLNAVLGIIAFKFQTSVWGTIFSIIYREVFLEPYFIKRQKIFSDIQDKLFELENETTKSLLSKQLCSINIMKVVLAEFNSIFHSKMEVFSSYVKRMDDLLEQFNSSVMKALNDNRDDIINNQNLIAEKQSSLIKALQDITMEMNQKLIEYSAETRDKFLKAQEESAENQDSRLVEITRTIETLQKVFIRSEDEYIKRTQANLLTAMREHVHTIHKEYLKEAENIAAIMERIRIVSDRMGTDVENMHKSFIDEQKNTGKMMKDMYKKIGDTMTSVSSNSDKQIATINKISIAMENTADVKNKELAELKKVIDAGIEGIIANVSTFTAESTGITEAIESNTEANKRATEKLADSIRNSIKATSGVNLSIGDLKSSVNETKSSVVDSVLAVENAVRNISVGIEKIDTYPKEARVTHDQIADLLGKITKNQLTIDDVKDVVDQTNNSFYSTITNLIKDYSDKIYSSISSLELIKSDESSNKDSDKK